MKDNLAAVVRRSYCTTLILLAAGLASGPAFSELANISSRAFVGTDDAVLIPGFIVNGESDDYLILVQGPSLSESVPNTLADPRLEVRDQDTGALIAENDNWADGPSAAQIAASGLELHPLEPGLILTLDPGAYSVVVRGAGVTTGNATASVFDVDQFDDGGNGGGAIAAGEWAGSGTNDDGSSYSVCLNVSADGTRLTASGSTCTGGAAFAVGISDVTDSQGGTCSIDVQIMSDVDILSGNTFGKQFIGNSGLITSVVGTFSGTTAIGSATTLAGGVFCVGEWTAEATSTP